MLSGMLPRGIRARGFLLAKAMAAVEGAMAGTEEPASHDALLRAVLLDEAIIFEEEGSDDNAGVRLHAGAERLLIRLQYSGLCLGLLSLSSNLSPNKILILEELGVSKFLPPVILDEAHPHRTLQAITSRWGVSGNSCLYVCATTDGSVCKELRQDSWKIVTALPGLGAMPYMQQLDSLPSLIANLNKKALGNDVAFVGHCMKWSREKDLLQRGAMPMLPTECGLAFVPISLELPFEKQLAAVDIVLNKATDEIVSVSKTQSDRNFGGIKFSEGFQKLENYLNAHPKIRVIDPTDRVMPLMDRLATQMLLQTLPSTKIAGGGTVRPPHSLKVTCLDEPDLIRKLKSASVGLPTIVKPQIACGASESHTMAVVFGEDGYVGLPVPLPAIIQEYVDHRSIIYKFYVIGEEIFYSTRKSTPDAVVLRSKLSTAAPAIVFDSLKSLPTGDMDECVAGVDIEAMRATATLLRKKLDLTIIGFDVVIQVGTNDHVIVDVNYFPTFKDISSAEAIPAFWESLQASRHV